MALTTRQATLNFSIIISVWLFHVNVLTIIISENFMLYWIVYCYHSQHCWRICELFLVKNCMRLVFSKFSDNKCALNQLVIYLNASLMSFIHLVGFGLVMIRLVLSVNKTNLDLLLFFVVFVIFVISLIQSKNNNGPSTEPCGTPCLLFPNWSKICSHYLLVQPSDVSLLNRI
jgi:hypothetical protein